MIVGFNDAPYFFLNNKYSCNIFILDRRFGNAESAYQAHKTKEPQIMDIFTSLDGLNAQSIGREVNTYEGWENDKIKVMLLVVFEKFRQNPDILEKLLDTGEQKLVAVSLSKENFWGIYDGSGENILGKILMYVRKYFKDNMPLKHEKLHEDWKSIYAKLEILKNPIESYRIFNDCDLDNNNNNFEECIDELKKLKIEIEDYMKFFLVDADMITKSTNQFVD